ncbi:vWA domain-containing protein [Methanosarcina barkeri]|uniref:von Willebrand factor domain-containing protein n=1 Tax=Methanosarcina barkeri CM1 TaxID=796385 RepID=A0A0G3CCD5_METBA|nr:VWA domain-containing protein [Methanosarcina barkeri]AKJ39659.1 von Willebrand factor domain-containing protein [Methanosarcina barkeri CM1]
MESSGDFPNNPGAASYGTYSFSENKASGNKGLQDLLILQNQTATVLKRDLRNTIAFPRTIPRPIREKIAEIITLEILFGQPYEIKDPKRFIETFGAFYPILLTLRNSKPWPKLRKIAKKSRGAGIAGLKILLPLIYEILGHFSESTSVSGTECLKELDAGMDEVLRQFEEILKETLLMWGNSGPAEFSGRKDHEMKNSGESALVDVVLSFMQKGGYQEFLERVMEGLYRRMNEFVSEMEENLELFDTLALLFPRRNWSYSVKELKKEPFYVQLKMLKNYSTFFEKSPDLKKIIDFIGRREFDPPSDHICLSPFGKNRIQTVRFSDSINNLLPMEAAKLLNPSLKKKFYADMLEGKLLSYQLLGKHYTGPPRIKPRGPMIVLVDTSGSMHGAPQTLAKSAVLAMAKLMLSQQRDMKVILFASTNQHLEIELSSRNKMSEKFLNFLLYTFGGGTDFNTALASGLKSLKEKDFQGADLLFITDGKSEVSDELVLARWEEAKKKYNAKVYSLIVGSSGAGGLSEISDYIYFVEMEMDSEGRSGFVRLIKFTGEKHESHRFQ